MGQSRRFFRRRVRLAVNLGSAGCSGLPVEGIGLDVQAPKPEPQIMKSIYVAIAGVALMINQAQAAEPFSINDALRQAVKTNPGVGEAAANRRATESELRQTQSTLLPQVRIEGRYGPEKFNDSSIPPLTGNGTWRRGNESAIVVRQLLFDGFASIHDIWRQSARVNASALRVRERTELIALDAAEAYVDMPVCPTHLRPGFATANCHAPSRRA